MQAPDNPACLLAYAQMLAARGEIELARSLLHALAAQLPAEHPLQARISRALAAPSGPPGVASSHARRMSAWLAQGYSSNYNQGHSLTSLSLTLPEGPVSLPVTADERAQARHFQTLGLKFTQGPVSASMQADHHPGQGWDRVQAQGQYLWSGTRQALALRLLLESSNVETSAQPPAQQLGLHHAWALNPQLALLTHLSQREEGQGQPAATQLGLGLLWQPHPGLNLLAQWGEERPWQMRAGGTQQQAALVLGYQTPLHAGDLLVQGGCQYTRDAEGYSPLLDNGNPRHLSACFGRLQWSAPLARHLSLEAGLELWRQSSNLALFAHQGAQIRVGLRLLLPSM